MNDLFVIGAGGHGKVVADIAKKVGYTQIAFLDDNFEMNLCTDCKVVGGTKEALKYKNSDFIVAVGNEKIREKIQNHLENNGLNVVTLIHPNSVVAENAEIGIGTVVMAGAVVNPYAKIGRGCIINTCASVDHDCFIGDYVHVSVGAHIAGTVTIGENTWVGAGAIISNNVSVCENCMIGAGAVIVHDINKQGVYIGVPARRMYS